MSKQLDSGDYAWSFTCISLVFLQAGAVAIINSSTVQAKNRTYVLLLSVIAIGVAFLEWYFFCYSLVFSKTASSIFIGNLSDAFLINLLALKTENQFFLLNFLSQLSGIALTISLLVAGGIERTSIRSMVFFIIFWIPLVYCFCNYWVFGRNGWGKNYGFLDYSCGIPNLVIALSVLVYTLFIGPRRLNSKPLFSEQSTFCYLAIFLIWFTWLGLNGGGTGGANARALISLINTNIAAGVGLLTAPVLSYMFVKTSKYDPSLYFKGLLAGLLCVSPAAGFIRSYYSIIFGFLGGVICLLTIKLKEIFKIDEPNGIIETHGTPSIVGILLTSLFAENAIATLSGGNAIGGGFIDHNFVQLPVQLLVMLAVIAWTLVMTSILCFVLRIVPFFKFKIHPDYQDNGLDNLYLRSNYNPNLTAQKAKE